MWYVIIRKIKQQYFLSHSSHFVLNIVTCFTMSQNNLLIPCFCLCFCLFVFFALILFVCCCFIFFFLFFFLSNKIFYHAAFFLLSSTLLRAIFCHSLVDRIIDTLLFFRHIREFVQFQWLHSSFGFLADQFVTVFKPSLSTSFPSGSLVLEKIPQRF